MYYSLIIFGVLLCKIEFNKNEKKYILWDMNTYGNFGKEGIVPFFSIVE